MNFIRNRNFRAGPQTSLEGFICPQNSDKQQKIKVFGRSGGGTILNMVTMSRSLDIPKAERFRYFSETDIISAECSFSARTYLYRIFKLKEGCTPTEWREKMAENVAAEDKKQD